VRQKAPSGPDPQRTAAILQGVALRVSGAEPVQARGDELEIVDYVLSAFGEVEIEESMHLQALIVLLVGLLPAFVLAEIHEFAAPDSDFAWMTSLDPESARLMLEQSGVAAWCGELGFPLEMGGKRLDASKKLDTYTTHDVLKFVREGNEPPPMSSELAAHDALDNTVRKALPLCADTLRRVRAEEDFDPDELLDLRATAFKLLAVCRLTGPLILGAIAWGESDSEGVESWLTYLALASLFGLNLRLLSDTNSPAERSALLHVDEDDLVELTEGLERADL
jgi:hypothetical protein